MSSELPDERDRPMRSHPPLSRPLRAVGIGELLWDLLPGGPRLGGAPFNVVAHLRRLGFDATYVSAVGRDELGERTLAEVARLGVDTSAIQVVDVPTGIVRVELDAAGVPTFEIVSPAAYEATEGRVAAVPADPDVLVFGTLAQRFPGVIQATQALAEGGGARVRLYDVNLRVGCWDADLVRRLAALATVVKLNEEEARVLAEPLGVAAADLAAFTSALADRFGLRGVCVTRGADGAALLLDGAFLEAPAAPVVVADTVGAGDAFAAGLAAGIAYAWPSQVILEVATQLAGLVASREGAIPEWDIGELAAFPPAAATVAVAGPD